MIYGSIRTKTENVKITEYVFYEKKKEYVYVYTRIYSKP